MDAQKFGCFVATRRNELIKELKILIKIIVAVPFFEMAIYYENLLS